MGKKTGNEKNKKKAQRIINKAEVRKLFPKTRKSSNYCGVEHQKRE